MVEREGINPFAIKFIEPIAKEEIHDASGYYDKKHRHGY